ncbi:MAG: parB-like partition protein [Pseudonocardia sp.]|nr:parB-like partition protein [Pseudonocardia sp.]
MSRALGALPIYKLIADPRNLRGRLDGLEELAASIRSVGLLQPLVVTPAGDGHRYRIVAGHRRHAAAEIVGLEKLPCVVIHEVSESSRVAMQLVENSQRTDLTPMEQARGLAGLCTLLGGPDLTDLARFVGRSRGWVSDRLALLDLPADAQQLVRDGQITTREATTLARQVRRTGSGQVTRARCPQHFGRAHPLAGTARMRCDMAGHPQAGRLGDVACGQCWEHTIRDDTPREAAA